MENSNREDDKAGGRAQQPEQKAERPRLPGAFFGRSFFGRCVYVRSEPTEETSNAK